MNFEPPDSALYKKKKPHNDTIDQGLSAGPHDIPGTSAPNASLLKATIANKSPLHDHHDDDNLDEAHDSEDDQKPASHRSPTDDASLTSHESRQGPDWD